MTIDFKTRLRNLNLAYLFRGDYHDEDGVERRVYWCGPKSRVGSGLTVPEPIWTWNSEDTRVQWESRMKRCSLEATMGNITQSIQTVSDLTFNIEISGGPLAEEPVPGELRRDIVFGRWARKRAALWLLDLDTGDTQMVAMGYFDRDPTSVTPGMFAVTVTSWPLFPEMLFPTVGVPHNTDGYTYDQPHTDPFHWWGPTQFMLNPHHMDREFGPSYGFVSTSLAETDEAGFGYREAVPYGRRVSASSGEWVFAWCAPQYGCYVSEVYYEASSLANEPIKVQIWSFDTFENQDPTMGPLGTCIRFHDLGSGPAPMFVWWGPASNAAGANDYGATGRLIVRISGPGSALLDRVEYDVDGGRPVRVMKGPYANNGGLVTRILWETTEGPTFPMGAGLNIHNLWGTTAMADFDANTPMITLGPATPQQYVHQLCTVPVSPVEDPLLLRDVFGWLGLSYPFDIVQKWDETAQELRLFPLWRISFSSAPLRVFNVGDMQRTDPPEIMQLSNKDGKYANVVSILAGERINTPEITTGNPQGSAGENNIMPLYRDFFSITNTVELTPENAAAKILGKTEWKYWQHKGLPGNSTAGWFLGMERAQPQRSITALHGVTSYASSMGDPIAYNIPGVNRSVGQIRKMLYDFDKQNVRIESLHIEHWAPGRNTPPDHRDPRDDPKKDGSVD